MKILITGNPVDGLEFFGPFDEAEEATEFAEINAEADWWVAEVRSPADPEGLYD